MADKHVSTMSLDELREECRNRGLDAQEGAMRTDLMERIILHDAGLTQPDLPEPGYKRDEELARRTDALEEKIETEAPEVYPIDPKAFEEDREILHRSIEKQMVQVSEKDLNYIYCWTYYGQNSQQVWAKKALGWEVVTGDMKEAREHIEADGTRRIGDTLLMRVRKERFEQLEADATRRRQLQHDSVGSRLLELEDKARGYGLRVHQSLDTVQVGNQTLMDVVERRSAAKQTAMKHIDKKLRDGTVPGMPAPKKD